MIANWGLFYTPFLRTMVQQWRFSFEESEGKSHRFTALTGAEEFLHCSIKIPLQVLLDVILEKNISYMEQNKIFKIKPHISLQRFNDPEFFYF